MERRPLGVRGRNTRKKAKKFPETGHKTVAIFVVSFLRDMGLGRGAPFSDPSVNAQCSYLCQKSYVPTNKQAKRGFSDDFKKGEGQRGINTDNEERKKRVQKGQKTGSKIVLKKG